MNSENMKALEQLSMQSASGHPIDILVFDKVDYQTSYQAMSEFAATRDDTSRDQIWLLQHPPVYTQGTACDQETLFASDIPVVKTDRGGQITYHGPGQMVMYPLLRLKRFGLGVKALVSSIEQCVIDTLEGDGVVSKRREDAPGVYVGEAKIAALGLRIRRGNSYHGLSVNVDMDLSPFSNVDPCGYKGMAVTQVVDQTPNEACVDEFSIRLLQNFLKLI